MKNRTAKTVIVLTALVTACMHLLNRVQCSLCTVKNLLSSVSHHYYEWRFGKICYQKKGSGNPLLLIHDLTPGSSSYEFHRLLDGLAKTNEVYALDLLGYGLSDKPNITYTSYLYIQLITDFIKNVIGKKTDMIASGDSAPFVIMACHNDPEVCNKMVFINPQSLYQANQIPSKQTKSLKLLIDAPIFGTFIYNILNSSYFMEKNFYETGFCNPTAVKEEYLQAYKEAAHTPDYHSKYAFASYIGRYMNTNIIHALKEINHSICIIAGKEKEDNETIVENYLYYNHSIETVFMPKIKQLPHLENPEEVLAQINIFL